MHDENWSMRTEPNRGKDFTYLTVYPSGYKENTSYPMIIMLHGFGASMYDLAGLAQVIHDSGYIYVCPNAPIPLQIGPGSLGFAWAVSGGDDAVARSKVDQKLEAFWEEAMNSHNVRQGECLLLGFSQGGGLAYKHGLTRPDMFSGIVALSCSIRDESVITDMLPKERDQEIFVAHGLSDNIESARSSVKFLEMEGYHPKYKEYEMGHEISQDVLNDLIPWIQGVLPPYRAQET